MKNTIKLGLLALAMLSTQATAEEVNTYLYEDEPRAGWFGGLGLGVHNTTFDLSGFSDTSSETGVASSIKIGYNFTEQFAISYVRNAAWYSLNNDTFISGITGLGATYYFLPQQETWYASVVAGIGDYANLDDVGSETGSAFMGTIGYEFAPHWQAEASYMFTSIDDSYGDTLETSSIQLLINYSWY